MKKLTLAALGIIALAALPVSAANWSDTSIGYRYGTQFREPGLMGTIEKNIVSLTHVSGWDYGQNFFNVDMLMSSKQDPAMNTNNQVPYSGGQPQEGITGANEVYVTYNSSLSLGKLTKSNLAFGPVKDISLTGDFEFNSKENSFASKKRFIAFGPTFAFNVKNGFASLGIWACHEQNYNGVTLKPVDFKTDFELTLAWGLNYKLGVPVEFKGFCNYLGSKGKDGFGADTKPETLCDMALMFDVSQFIGRKKGAVSIGPGFEFWNNKFGGANYTNTNPSTPYNNNQPVHAFMAQAEIHF